MDNLVRQPSTVAAPEECPEVKPCIEELLRTAHHPDELFVRVERIVEVPVLFARAQTPAPESGSNINHPLSAEDNELGETGQDAARPQPRHRTFRLWVSDGEFVMQALLKKELHPFVSMGDVVPGAVISLQAFKLRLADRIRPGPISESRDGSDGRKITFLAIEQFRTVWRPDSAPETGELDGTSGIERGDIVVKKRARREDQTGQGRVNKRLKSGSEREGFDTVEKDELRERALLETAQQGGGRDDAAAQDEDLLELQVNPTGTSRHQGFAVNSSVRTKGERLYTSTASRSADSTDFLGPETSTKETISLQGPLVINSMKSKDRERQTQPVARRALHNTPTPTSQKPPATAPAGRPQQPTPSPSSIMPIPKTPQLCTLAYLLNPPQRLPQRNYPVSIVAIVSWISPTTRALPHTRLPPKRDLRIVDSTLPFRTSGILLSVFVDAENFLPPAGTLALFTGLKTHEYEGVSLNAYEVDCGGKEWFMADERRLTVAGHDVAKEKAWWERRCAELGGG